ncbi:protein kinase domain-containing protein [Nannocystis bainbridge]|uniref:Protein kinase n=1 Tax=Nannocystis bainbridge TaxID=2995303 RepID=A0ABT5EBS6_9BACT|nr:protein kinase [Nannocystis bainbridge]MDC0722855.1 protein kinase [Nannocystis bainbridge]
MREPEPITEHDSGASDRFMRLFAEHREQAATADASAGGAFDFPAEDVAAFSALIGDRYRIERELGRGGMGVVFLGHDHRLERCVALKVLPRAHGESAAHQRRFLREARTVAKLSHPHIVPILHAEEAGPFAYFTMAYVEGETLAERIRRAGRMPVVEVVKVLREVAWALAYSHACGVVHRDVKPENILLERATGRALVSDFGIAQQVGDAGITGADHLVGTVLFMSPEQAQRVELDGRSDLYSLGVVGFWLLSGKYPFAADTALASLLQRVNRLAPPLRSVAPDVAPAIAAVIDRCLARAPDDRVRSGEELAEALERALHGEPKSGRDERALGEAEIGAALLQAAELRRMLREHAEAPAPIDRVCRALGEQLGVPGGVAIDLFERLALMCPGDADDLRVLAAAHGQLLPDPQHSTAADLGAMFATRDDASLFERLLGLSRGLPLHHPLVQRLHLLAARVRAHRDGADDGEVAARLLLEIRDLAARLLELRREGFGEPVVDHESATLGLYQEVLAEVRRNDGVRASKRLLDLARVRGASRSQLAAVGALAEQASQHAGVHAARGSDDAWFALLAALLESAGSLVSAGPDELAITARTDELRRGDLQRARRLFLARRGEEPPRASDAIFVAEAVGKSYGRRNRAADQVLGDVSLALHPGTITGVVGPNGCGKTTLLRIVAGQLAPDVGRVAYPRLDPPGVARGTTDWQRVLPQIGYVAQRPERWFGGLGDNLHRWAALHGVVGEDNAIEVEFYLNRLDLLRYRDAQWHELSGGYRMRFELARVMVARPRLLVLDEPLAPLDINSQETFLRDLRDLADMDGQQLPILLSSQHIVEVESIADTLLCLHQSGRPRFCGPARAVAGRGDERVYELGGAISQDLLDAVRQQFALTAHRAGERWIVRVPADVPEDRLLRALLARHGSVDYFRNITQSCVRFFRGDAS